MRIFAIGDTRGCNKELEELLKFIFVGEQFDPDKDQLLFIGDYVDRASHSMKVIDLLIGLKELYPNTVCLRGNHEDMFMSYLGIGGNYGSVFIMNGGDTTLLSYYTDTLPLFREMERRRFDHEIREYRDQNLVPSDAKLTKLIPQSHIDFLKTTQRYYDTPIATFVHAGLNPKLPIEAQDDLTLFWVNDNRDGFICRIRDNPWPKMLIHGHTPITDAEIKENIHKNRINIDTGYVYGTKYGDAGFLTCIVVDDTLPPEEWKLIQHEGDKISWRV